MSNRKRTSRTHLRSVLKTTVREADRFGRSLMGLHNHPLVTLDVESIGEAPGIEAHEVAGEVKKLHEPQTAVVTCIDFSPEKAEMQRITDVEVFLAQHRPE